MILLAFIVLGIPLLLAFVFAIAHIARGPGGMKKLGIILPVAAGALYFVHSLAFPAWTVRHRWTYEVEVDGKLHTGSGVMETTISTGFLCAGINGGHHCHGFRGEAVPIDLGARGMLFALLVSPNGGDGAVELGPEHIVDRLGLLKAWSQYGDDSRTMTWKGLARNGLRAELLSDEIPMLVRFKEIKDRMSVERIDPKNFAVALGPDVTFKRATFEITRDTVSTGIEKTLPWLLGLKGRPGYATAKLPDNNAVPPEPEHRINGTAFSSELYK
jgi:hypothetical protein